MEKSGDIETKVPSYLQMMYQICEEEGIKLQFLSRNWIMRLERGDQVHYVVGYKFDLNSQGTGLVADDKFATFEALKYAGVPVIQHEILYDFDDNAEHARGCNSLPYIMDFFRRHKGKMIIKANEGTCGLQVFKVTKPDQLIEILPKVFRQSYTASMCPFYGIRHEYRVVLLDGEERLSYIKTNPTDEHFNLSCGAQAEPMPSDKHAQILKLAKQAAEAINLRFGSVDIIETTSNDFLILEINSGVMTTHYLKQHPEEYPRVRAMYRDAIRKMFAEK